MHLHTVYMEYSECLPTLLTPWLSGSYHPRWVDLLAEEMVALLSNGGAKVTRYATEQCIAHRDSV